MGPAYNVFFNMAKVNTPPLSPETSNSYEVGLKAKFFDRKVQANLSAFITDFQNYQANFTQLVAGALVTNLINAGSITSRGVEGDITAKPIHGLTLDADFAYDDAHVVNFPCPAGSAIACNINGEPLPFAPRWKTHLEGDYRTPLNSAFDLDLESDYNWQSQTQYQLSETPNTIQGAYGIWNASVGILGTSNGWSGRVLVKNIADTHYSPYLAGGDLGGLVRWVPRDEQRYVGVNIRKTF
jgi:iron complex outermembrane receptor protein